MELTRALEKGDQVPLKAQLKSQSSHLLSLSSPVPSKDQANCRKEKEVQTLLCGC